MAKQIARTTLTAAQNYWGKVFDQVVQADASGNLYAHRPIHPANPDRMYGPNRDRVGYIGRGDLLVACGMGDEDRDLVVIRA